MKYFIGILILLIFNLFFQIIFSIIGKKQNKNIKNGVSNHKGFLANAKSLLYSVYCLNLMIISIIPSFTLRKIFYQYFCLMKIGKGSKIRGFCEIIFPWNIEIGDNVMIGKSCVLDGRKGIRIGNSVNISDRTAIWTEQHDINSPDFLCNNAGGSVYISDFCWLCYRCIILPKIEISIGSVIATGAVVTKNCGPYCLYAGIPAKQKGKRTESLNYRLDIDRMHIY